MKVNKRQINKIIFLIFIFVLTKIYVINPIEKKKRLLETEKSKIAQEVEEVERYKKQVEVLKESEKKKNDKKIFGGKDDVIEIQNTINNIVEVKSIENRTEIDDNGAEKSNISLKFSGTYEEMFKVMDALSARGLSRTIKSVSVEKISQRTIPDIKEITEPNSGEKTKQAGTVFECTLKLNKN